MRRHFAAVGATLTALGMTALFLAATVFAATPATSQANAALRYLYGQVGTNGSIAGSLGATEDTVISVADSGFDPATLKGASGTTAYHYLSTHASAISTAGGAAKYVLAWVAAGKPAAIDASAWLTKLNAPAGGGGFLEPNGAFHNGNATIETANAFSQSLAVLADLAAGHSLPAHATGWLRCAQRPGGGFGYAINDAAATPPSFCGDTSSDTNDTGIVMQALGRAGVVTATPAVTIYLHSAQQPDGGFSFGTTGSSDPDSDAIVIQALVAIGQDPTGAAWRKGGHNPLTNLESFADPHGSGGYIFPGNTVPDAFTTSAIPQALVLKPYATATDIAAGTSPPPASTPTPAPTGAVKAVSTGPPVPSTGGATAGGSAPPLALFLVALGAACLGVGLRGRRADCP
ncbi:MAG TPA: hypothetical protein VH661_01365 [Candidatus Dormibacteraeota bacterium]|nr:hypothetical protein [Candidatus Dormibacteraeota bacterium]